MYIKCICNGIRWCVSLLWISRERARNLPCSSVTAMTAAAAAAVIKRVLDVQQWLLALHLLCCILIHSHKSVPIKTHTRELTTVFNVRRIAIAMHDTIANVRTHSFGHVVVAR